MRAYWQHADTYWQHADKEVELVVAEPDPRDGTWVVVVPGVLGWMRVCPEPDVATGARVWCPTHQVAAMSEDTGDVFYPTCGPWEVDAEGWLTFDTSEYDCPTWLDGDPDETPRCGLVVQVR